MGSTVDVDVGSDAGDISVEFVDSRVDRIVDVVSTDVRSDGNPTPTDSLGLVKVSG